MQPPDPRWRAQRELVKMWLTGIGRIGKWWRKDQIVVTGMNGETVVRRCRELVQTGIVEQRLDGLGVARYRAPLRSQIAADGTQAALFDE